MKANRLPDPKEIGNGPAGEQALRLAVRAAELAVDEPITPTTQSCEMILGEGVVKLPQFPLRNIKVDGNPLPTSIDAQEEVGILHCRLRPTKHLITYDVGYYPGEVPAVIKALITSLGRYSLTKSEEERGTATDLIRTARRLRAQARAERDAIKVDRES